ncbi:MULTISPECIES: SUMF1/EgtB/PvdO family nonheme iron enzyme [unclassified Streptomyces]|uniref:formylglycine-generating enzyme family protein n=1 Tax=unclassified Streptomyces TaxID=2593676 RepID=UPI00344FBA5F
MGGVGKHATCLDYEGFVRATGHLPPQHWLPGSRCPRGLRNHPTVWVTWRDANVYAHWADKVLPSARQWEKAACGPMGRAWPWGEKPTAAKRNTAELGIDSAAPVARCQSGASPYGVHDLCGEVWGRCSTLGVDGPYRHQLKGSAFSSPFERAAPALENTANRSMKDNYTGFRCASPS